MDTSTMPKDTDQHGKQKKRKGFCSALWSFLRRLFRRLRCGKRRKSSRAAEDTKHEETKEDALVIDSLEKKVQGDACKDVPKVEENRKEERDEVLEEVEENDDCKDVLKIEEHTDEEGHCCEEVVKEEENKKNSYVKVEEGNEDKKEKSDEEVEEESEDEKERCDEKVEKDEENSEVDMKEETDKDTTEGENEEKNTGSHGEQCVQTEDEPNYVTGNTQHTKTFSHVTPLRRFLLAKMPPAELGSPVKPFHFAADAQRRPMQLRRPLQPICFAADAQRRPMQLRRPLQPICFAADAHRRPMQPICLYPPRGLKVNPAMLPQRDLVLHKARDKAESPQRPWVNLGALSKTVGPDERFLLSRATFVSGAQLAAFRVTERLGEGSFGTADLVQFNGHRAVKKTLISTTNKAGFMWEARVLHELDCAGGAPRLLVVCDDPAAVLLEDAGVRYDEYYETATVRELIRSLVKVARCLYDIHNKGFLHNDLKFDNITVSGPRSNPVFHIIDFGLATRIGDRFYFDFFGMPRELVMEQDAFFRSRELKQGKPLRPSSDVFSFGMLIAWILGDMHNEDLTRYLRPIMDSCIQPEPIKRASLRSVALEFKKLREWLSEEQLEAPIRPQE